MNTMNTNLPIEALRPRPTINVSRAGVHVLPRLLGIDVPGGRANNGGSLRSPRKGRTPFWPSPERSDGLGSRQPGRANARCARRPKADSELLKAGRRMSETGSERARSPSQTGTVHALAPRCVAGGLGVTASPSKVVTPVLPRENL